MDQLVRFQRYHRVGPSFIIAELDLKNSICEFFNQCAHLPGNQLPLREVLQ